MMENYNPIGALQNIRGQVYFPPEATRELQRGVMSIRLVPNEKIGPPNNGPSLGNTKVFEDGFSRSLGETRPSF